MKRRLSYCIVMLCMLFASGCAPKILRPEQLTAPAPIRGNSGEFMCPYTQDDVLAEWTDKALNAKMGAAIGRTAGAYAGQKAIEMVPFVGGYLGSKVGESVGRKIAVESAGGWEYIKQTSDLSFNNIDDLSVYLYVRHSSNDHFKAALDATMEIYPEMKKRYAQAIINASQNPIPAIGVTHTKTDNSTTGTKTDTTIATKTKSAATGAKTDTTTATKTKSAATGAKTDTTTATKTKTAVTGAKTDTAISAKTKAAATGAKTDTTTSTKTKTAATNTKTGGIATKTGTTNSK